MARIILGEKPNIQAKSFKYTLPTEFITRMGQGELETILGRQARVEQVPAEATLTVWHDPVTDAAIYSWRWWEVTI